MELIQYRYPFEAEVIKVPQRLERAYVHIGVSMPYNHPWWLSKSGYSEPSIKITINGEGFKMNPMGILEFADTHIDSFEIDLSEIWENERILRQTIVDIAYQNEEV